MSPMPISVPAELVELLDDAALTLQQLAHDGLDPQTVEAAAAASRIPTGHPEGYYEAFANIYGAFTDTIRAKILGKTPDKLACDFPGPRVGARGVYFIHKVVESSASDVKWLPYNPPV